MSKSPGRHVYVWTYVVLIPPPPLPRVHAVCDVCIRTFGYFS